MHAALSVWQKQENGYNKTKTSLINTAIFLHNKTVKRNNKALVKTHNHCR